jgi:uncharacterized protein
MNKLLYVFFSLILITIGCKNSLNKDTAGQPIRLDAASAEAIKKEIEKDREETRTWLRASPTSYLAAIDRIDFEDKKTLTAGKASDNDVPLASSDIENHHLQVFLEGDRFRIVTVDPKAVFKAKDALKKEDTVDPSYIQVGRYQLRLSHQRFPAIIVFDPQSPHYKKYKGLEYFPVDLSYRYELPLQLDAKQEKIMILSTRGSNRAAERIGWFDFCIGKQMYRLEATRLLEPGSKDDNVSVFFKDATNGKETYPLGRYVDVEKLKNGKYLLDFNRAYNAACAFSEYYNCPVPPKANTLTAAIRAGEKDPHYH